MRRPDFHRNVHCVMGLPFDAVSEATTEQIVRRTVAAGGQCFMSTPNLNFAVACLDDADFRDSVIRSDLSIADGMPIIGLARMLGAPLPQRVAGSGLFERLMRAPPANAITAFFFGGEGGVAARAAQRLADAPCGVTCAGYLSPGFGSIEDMSREQVIAQINASGADFLVVAVGAKKGQAWLLRNLDRLRVPVVSYLGAVINFVAGTVRRAPAWMQRLHLEWFWRILQEPSLWRRYWKDGTTLARVTATQAVPAAIVLRWKAPSTRHLAGATLSSVQAADGPVFRLQGPWTAQNLQALREALDKAASQGHAPSFDLSAATYIDTAVVGLLVLASALRPAPVIAASAIARRILGWTGAAYLLAAQAAQDLPNRGGAAA